MNLTSVAARLTPSEQTFLSQVSRIASETDAAASAPQAMHDWLTDPPPIGAWIVCGWHSQALGCMTDMCVAQVVAGKSGAPHAVPVSHPMDKRRGEPTHWRLYQPRIARAIEARKIALDSAARGRESAKLSRRDADALWNLSGEGLEGLK